MKKITQTPHDRLMRASFNNVEVAKDFIKTHLPQEILKVINLKSLAACSNTYITPDLEQTASDVLYKAKTSNNKDCYIYCLIEHQSSACWDMPLRFLDYQVSILKSHKEQYPKQKNLPIVVPLLIYNGTKTPYPHTLNIFELFNDVHLAKKTLCAPARLIDLTTMSDAKIKQHSIISLLEFTQKHVRDRKILNQTIDTLVYIINKLDKDINKNNIIAGGIWFKNYVESNLHYLYYFANIIDDQEFTAKLETVNFVKEENIMGVLARKIEQQGIIKGIAEGIQKGKAEGIAEGIKKGKAEGIVEAKKETAKVMLQEGVDLNFISKVTGLSLDEINQLK